MIAVTQPLFAWDARDVSPSLRSVRGLLEAVPDPSLILSLQLERNYPRRTAVKRQRPAQDLSGAENDVQV